MNTKLALVLVTVALFSVACAKKQRPVMMSETYETPTPDDQANDPKPSKVEAGDDDVYSRTPIYFDYNSSDLRHESRSELARLGARMLRNTDLALTIEGNTDERGSTEFNLALGERRARAARDYLVKLGVASNRVDVVSYGEERPAMAGENEAAWSANRRDEFVLTN